MYFPQNFVVDNTTCSQPGVFDGGNASLLNEVICEHLLRQGRLDIAEQLIMVTQPLLPGAQGESTQENLLSRHMWFLYLFGYKPSDFYTNES